MSRRTKPRTLISANRTTSAREATVRPLISSRWTGWAGATVRDAQADVPSARWLRAQLAFKDSMVHGILQFTPSIAFRYVLHRCESRDIRCRESFRMQVARRACLASFRFLGAWGAGVWLSGAGRGPPPREFRSNRFAGRSFCVAPTMILPQVHLRKPCYDFSFL